MHKYTAQRKSIVSLLLCFRKIAGWVKILQYAQPYTPTANAVGDLSKSTADGGFAKLSDAAINAIPADNNGYSYFKLEDAGEDPPHTLMVRTKAAFQDTAIAFGWSNNFQVCNTDDLETCNWKKGSVGAHFDSEEAYGNGCDRWFTDHRGQRCYIVAGSKRCFSQGSSCGHATRDHVTMYKWSAQIMATAAITTTEKVTVTKVVVTSTTASSTTKARHTGRSIWSAYLTA